MTSLLQGPAELHRPGRPGLPHRPRLAKAHATDSGGHMSGIYMILAFVAVFAALNRFEFGRFD